jgi:carbon storage regulator
VNLVEQLGDEPGTLVLTRKVDERIIIDNSIVVQVLEIKGGRVRIGIAAPPGVKILRGELIVDRAAPPAVSDGLSPWRQHSPAMPLREQEAT